MVEFDHVFIPIPIDEFVKNGCHRGAVNLWTPGLENEKIQICGDRKNIRIGGVGQTLMVELKIIDQQLDVDFRMQYRLIPLERLFNIFIISNRFIFFVLFLLKGPITVSPLLIEATNWSQQKFAGKTTIEP